MSTTQAIYLDLDAGSPYPYSIDRNQQHNGFRRSCSYARGTEEPQTCREPCKRSEDIENDIDMLICRQLRQHNQPNAANKVGKLSVEISQAVQEAMAYIPQCDVFDNMVRFVWLPYVCLA
jgi:hypothetical protein